MSKFGAIERWYIEAEEAIRQGDRLINEQVPPGEVQVVFLQAVAKALMAITECLAPEEIDS